MLDQFLAVNIWYLLLVTARIGTMIGIVPGFAAGYVTPRHRVALAVTMSFALLPVLSPYLPSLPASPATMFLILAGEIVVGAFLGTIAIVIISALQSAGTFISYFSSMANALVQDAVAEQQSSVVAGFLSIMGILLIFVTDMHHMMIRALVDSFLLFPPGEPLMAGDMSNIIARNVADAFALGLRLASPLLLVALVYYMSIGVLGRLMPQLQVFFFGLPMQITVQIWVLMTALSGMMMVFLEAFQEVYSPFLSP